MGASGAVRARDAARHLRRRDRDASLGAVRPRRARDVRDAETVGADDAGAKFKEKVRRDVGARHGRVDGDRTIARGGAVGSRAERRDRGAGRRGAGGDDEGAAGATRGEARGAGDRGEPRGSLGRVRGRHRARDGGRGRAVRVQQRGVHADGVFR